MFGLKMFLAGLVLGAGGMLFSMQFHVMRTNTGLTVVPRTHQPPLRSTYVDVRRWSVAMWQNYPEVTEALVKSGRVDVLGTGAVKSLIPEAVESQLNGLGDSVRDQTKKAIEAIVPIRFTNQQGNIDTVIDNAADRRNEPFVPLSSHGQDEPPRTLLPENRPVQQGQASLPAAASEEVFPATFKPTGLPVLQRPIPITENVQQRNPVEPSRAEPAAQENPSSQPEWVRGLLRSLIPESPVSTPATRDHGQAHSGYEYDAPGPRGQPIPTGSPWSPTVNPPQSPYPQVRPF